MKSKSVLLLAGAFLGISACSTSLDDYKDTGPTFSLQSYFNGDVTAWGIVQDTAELKAACDGIDNLDDFVKALAENFLKEPALGARAETYEALGLPPPDESGALHSQRKPPSIHPLWLCLLSC